MSRVLVTGASGFIGSRLWRRLVDEGNEVHCVSRHPHGGDGARWWQADLTDPDATADLVQGIQPETIHHLASLNVGSRDLDVVLPVLQHNLVLTVNLLVAAVRADCGLVVLAGSMEEPGPNERSPVPTSPYAAAKYGASGYARMLSALHGLRVIDLRISMVYGPGQRPPKVVPAAVVALLRGESPRLSSGSRPFDWVHVDDVVEAFVLAADRPDLAGERIDIGSGEVRTVREVVETIFERMGTEIEPSFGALPDRPLDEAALVADAERTAAVLGWRARTSLEEGLDSTIALWRVELDESLRPAEKGAT